MLHARSLQISALSLHPQASIRKVNRPNCQILPCRAASRPTHHHASLFVPLYMARFRDREKNFRLSKSTVAYLYPECLGYAHQSLYHSPISLGAGRARYLLSQYAEAIKTVEKAEGLNDHQMMVKVFLAASYLKAGLRGDAEWAVERIRVISPATTVSVLEQSLPIADLEKKRDLLASLREAGMPPWPEMDWVGVKQDTALPDRLLVNNITPLIMLDDCHAPISMAWCAGDRWSTINDRHHPPNGLRIITHTFISHQPIIVNQTMSSPLMNTIS